MEKEKEEEGERGERREERSTRIQDEKEEIKDGVGERGRGDGGQNLPPLKRHSDQSEGRGVGVGGDSADSTLSGSDVGRGGRRSGRHGEEKDKSHKRKSHLNRSTTSEEPASEPFPPAHPSDSNGEYCVAV
ncbi:hypothetical protein Pmani_023381 [Petrolisthes manimaculis]|uniref:Uncharacterized protein n=1 Tax=Petrolisthes manimaculis TaxID=1843537 RepID=A0AAE1TZN2_9EUCA|nr:hypothetical protein Pmani_023381 [Petrolisthes manimaculis]